MEFFTEMWIYVRRKGLNYDMHMNVYFVFCFVFVVLSEMMEGTYVCMG